VIRRILSTALVALAALTMAACSKDAKSGSDNKIGGEINPRVKEGQNLPPVPPRIDAGGPPSTKDPTKTAPGPRPTPQ
jgi:hypothetical protein